MLNKLLLLVSSVLIAITPLSYAQTDNDGMGQIIQIYTRFRSFVGKPTWLLEIRDLDHNETIPYLYDIRKGNNFWMALTYGRNYLITASRLQIPSYRSRYNKFRQYRINNFCNLESRGRIIRGESMYITITGDLTPDSCTYRCHVSRYPNDNFTIVRPDLEQAH